MEKGRKEKMLNDFRLAIKTQIIFGADVEKNVGEEVRKYADSCLLHYDGGPYLDALLNTVRKSLADAGVRVVELPGVQPTPRFGLIKKGMEICKQENLGFVLAVGGGSVMDSAKLIAGGTHFEGDVWNEFGKKPLGKVLPHGTITTLAGTGSEVSAAAMVQNDDLPSPVKKGFGAPELCFDFAMVDPKLLFTLPQKQTAAGSMDIVSHAMESYFSNTPHAYLLDGVLETVIRTAMDCALVCKDDPANYDARANLLLASYIGVQGLHLPPTNGDWVVHNIEKPLTNLYGGTHGVNLGILTLAWIKHSYKRDIPKFEQWAVRCMGVERDIYEPEKTIMRGVERLRHWLIDLGLPTTLTEIGIGDERFEEAAELALSVAGFTGREGTIGRVTKLTFDQILEVYRMAL